MTAMAVPNGRGRFSLTDLPVSTKVLGAVSIAGLVALVVGLSGLTALSGATTATERLFGNLHAANALATLRSSILQTRLTLGNHAVSQDAPTMAKYETRFAEDVRAVEAAFVAYRESDPVAEPAVLRRLEGGWQAYVEIARDRQIPASRRNDIEAWQATRDTEVGPLTDAMSKEIAALTAAEDHDAEKLVTNARSDYSSSRTLAVVMLVGGLLLAVGLGRLVARQIVRALNKVKHVCDGLAHGDLTRSAGLTSRDEPGQMGQSLDTAVVRLRETVTAIDGSASAVAGAAEQMSDVSTQIATSAEQTSMQAQAVSAASEEISRSVDSVSAGGDEMGASIREISRNASEAAQVASEAVGLAASTSTTMGKLGESSAEIGNVIKTITAIAEQTNLLALNATIEAARAGEAGKGFAVVASEVKDLAQETARATEDISRRVETIQSDTNGAVMAIEEITRVIARISDFQTTIASAVEEQTATTAEMNRSVSEAATGTGEIAQNIVGVAEAARMTSENVSRSQHVSEDLSRTSAELSRLVAGFRY